MKLCIACFMTSQLIILLSGCNSAGSAEYSARSVNPLITTDNFSRITGTQWILQKMIINGFDYPLSQERPFVQFETDGKISGFASLNRFFGSMQIDKQGNVKWSKALGSTRMAGPENLMKQEGEFLNALAKTEHLSIDGIYLQVYTKDRQTELIFYVPVK